MAVTAFTTVQSQKVLLATPGPGQTVRVTAPPDGIFTLQFSPDAAALGSEGKDLIFTFPDGGQIVISGFFDKGIDALPYLETADGALLSGRDFLAAFDPELLTAAGPGAGAAAVPSSGSGEYADDAGSLIDGIDRLGDLGTIYWDRETEVPENYGGLTRPAAAATDGPPPLPAMILHAHDNTALVRETGGGTLKRAAMAHDAALGDPPLDPYQYDASGNVIGDPSFVGLPTTGGMHAEGIDHLIDENGEAQPLGAGAYVSEWTFTNPYTGQVVTIDEGMYVNGQYTYSYQDNDVRYSITFYADGRYDFHAERIDGGRMDIDNFDISYTVQDGGSSDSAELYIRTGSHLIEGSHGDDRLTGTDGNDVIYGGDGQDVIYGGKGDDVMFGGRGNDLFAWKTEDLDGGTDTIKDFELGGDHLRFDGLFTDAELQNMDDLLASGKLSIHANSDSQLTLTLDAGGGASQTVQIHLENVTVDMTALNGDPQAQADLLQQIITNAGG